MASRAWLRSAWWCSQPARSRSSWLVGMSPARKRPRAWRSMGSAWRRLTVSSAVATRPCRTCSDSQTARPPAPTGWAWRGSPTIHTCPPGQATAAASTTSASRVDSWENSSTITTQPGRQLVVVQGEAGHGGGRDTHLAQLAHGLIGGRDGQDRPAGPAGRVHGGGQGGGLAVPGRGDHRPQPGPGPGQHGHRRGLIVTEPRRRRPGRPSPPSGRAAPPDAVAARPDGQGLGLPGGGGPPSTTGRGPGRCCPG